MAFELRKHGLGEPRRKAFLAEQRTQVNSQRWADTWG